MQTWTQGVASVMWVWLLPAPWAAVHLPGPRAPPRRGVLGLPPICQGCHSGGSQVVRPRLSGGDAGHKQSQWLIFQLRWTAETVATLTRADCACWGRSHCLASSRLLQGGPGDGALCLGLGLSPGEERKEEDPSEDSWGQAKSLLSSKKHTHPWQPPPSQAWPHSPPLPHSASHLQHQRRLCSRLRRESTLQCPRLHISQSTCKHKGEPLGYSRKREKKKKKILCFAACSFNGEITSCPCLFA